MDLAYALSVLLTRFQESLSESQKKPPTTVSREADSRPSARGLCCSHFQILNHFLHSRGRLSSSGFGPVQLSDSLAS